MKKDEYKHICTFAEELEVIKTLESLGFEIKHKYSCCCDYDEPFTVNFTGKLLINNPKMTSEQALYIAKRIGNSIDIDGIYPYIDEKGIIIRFSFSSVINEPYPYEKFDLYEQYEYGVI